MNGLQERLSSRCKIVFFQIHPEPPCSRGEAPQRRQGHCSQGGGGHWGSAMTPALLLPAGHQSRPAGVGPPASAAESQPTALSSAADMLKNQMK